MIWKSRIEHIRIPNSVRILLIDKLLNTVIYNIYSIGRICTVGDENLRSTCL
jgi:hypothetical protein